MPDPLVAVIDDDVSVRRALVRVLEAAGLRTEAFSSAIAFLQRARTARPECLVVDICLGGMDGFELIECLRAGGEAVPTVVITAHDDSLTRERTGRYGAAYLRKPLDAPAFLKEVFAALSAK